MAVLQCFLQNRQKPRRAAACRRSTASCSPRQPVPVREPILARTLQADYRLGILTARVKKPQPDTVHEPVRFNFAVILGAK